jgi:hypothetical protein
MSAYEPCYNTEPDTDVTKHEYPSVCSYLRAGYYLGVNEMLLICCRYVIFECFAIYLSPLPAMYPTQRPEYAHRSSVADCKLLTASEGKVFRIIL